MCHSPHRRRRTGRPRTPGARASPARRSTRAGARVTGRSMHLRQPEDQQDRRDVEQQHVLDHVHDEQLLAERVERRDERRERARASRSANRAAAPTPAACGRRRRARARASARRRCRRAAPARSRRRGRTSTMRPETCARIVAVACCAASRRRDQAVARAIRRPARRLRAELTAALAPPACLALPRAARRRRRARCACRAAARCRGCAARAARAARCRRRAARAVPARGARSTQAWAPLAHDGPARALVVALKFRGALPVARPDGGADGGRARRASCSRRRARAGPAAPGAAPARAASTRRGCSPPRSRRARGLPVVACLRRGGRPPRQVGAGRARPPRGAGRPAAARRAAPCRGARCCRRRPHDRRDARRLRARAARAGAERSRRSPTRARWRADLRIAGGIRPLAALASGKVTHATRTQRRRTMRIEIKGRNIPVTDELREHVERRFRKIARQVSELAQLEVELWRSATRRSPTAGRRGDAAPEGRHAARARRLARHDALDQPAAPTSSRARSSATATSAASAARRAPRSRPRRPSPAAARAAAVSARLRRHARRSRPALRPLLP